MNAFELGCSLYRQALIKEAAGVTRAPRLAQSKNPAAQARGKEVLRNLQLKRTASPRYAGLRGRGAQPEAAQSAATQPAADVATGAPTQSAESRPLLHGLSESIGNAVARGAYHLDPRLESGLLRMFGGADRGAMNLGAAALGAAPSLYYMATDPYYGPKTDQYPGSYGYPPPPRY
jgi:hypothetical protein